MPFDRNKPFNDLPPLPPRQDIETKAILKQAIKSNTALAELKIRGQMLPNQSVLINSLVLLEAKDSSEIENIFTTHDKLYEADVLSENDVDPSTKEVSLYRQALWYGVHDLKERPISTNSFIKIYQIIKRTDAGIRTTPGTKISAGNGGEIIYTPPEGEDRLRALLKNLEDFLHARDDIDPLIKMAVMHYQFEAIHPFTDGNGRSGRILNILYLLNKNLLDTPVLFLSRYIIENKTPYYKGLQRVTEEEKWEEWILYMLQAVEHTAIQTIRRIEAIEDTISEFAATMKKEATVIYSKDLVELLFEQPYCRIQIVTDRLGVKRQTASSYLRKLEDIGLLVSRKMGREIVYFNPVFIAALKKVD